MTEQKTPAQIDFDNTHAAFVARCSKGDTSGFWAAYTALTTPKSWEEMEANINRLVAEGNVTNWPEVAEIGHQALWHGQSTNILFALTFDTGLSRRRYTVQEGVALNIES